ncbi:NADP-dependent oxidoreductase domain-containing protein [Powellomyces hirtus]|nr:NADP-dependent oxidoreductase domain-containing protein [Powellomyces hirtus]
MSFVTSKPVGATGFGLMGFTWRPVQTPDEQAFATMKEALAHGANFWNGGEFYGSPEPELNLKLIQRYFATNPADAEKVVLSIKGGLDLQTLAPRGAPADIRRSIDNVLEHLQGSKYLDIFQCARVDPAVPIEETIAEIATYVKAGKIGGIGLSEVSAETIRRAHKVHPIATVEVEFSLWSTEILDNGVAKTCAELGIPIVAYSPLGRGFLTGHIKKPEDIPEGDFRRYLDRFQPENFAKNMDLLHAVEDFAAKRVGPDGKPVTPAQLALAWIHAQSGQNGLPVIIPIPGATTATRVAENMARVALSSEEKADIDEILRSSVVVGGRYNRHMEALLFQ